MDCKHELDWDNSYRGLVQCASCWDLWNIEEMVNALEARNEWVSVDERLPELGEPVEVGDFRTSLWDYDIKYYRTRKDENWRNDKGDVIEARFVTHWRPLPAPPQEVE